MQKQLSWRARLRAVVIVGIVSLSIIATSASATTTQGSTVAPRGNFKALSSLYEQRWLITYYTWTGRKMSNGLYPRIGWAACGYDVRSGARVLVPGYGTFSCGDHIGHVPWHHIDIYGIPLGTHYQNVYIYP